METRSAGMDDGAGQALDGANMERRTLAQHTKPVYCVAFSEHEPLLASGSSDNSVIVWDVTVGRARRTLRQHSAWVEALAGLHEVRARRARRASAARTRATHSRAPLATRSLRPHSARARWSRPTRRWSRPTRRRLQFDVKILSEKPRDPN